MEKIIKRNTVQSQIILETVQKMHSHVTAEEVFMQIQNSHPNISRATVYRNLNILYEEGKSVAFLFLITLQNSILCQLIIIMFAVKNVTNFSM